MSVTTASVERYKKALHEEGKANATINRRLAIIRRALRLGVKQGLVSTMPTVETLREDNAREGLLEPKELEPVVAQLPEELRDLTTFADLSAWRKREVVTLQWKSVDVENGVVSLSGNNSKNHRARTLPLEGELAQIIKRREAARAVRTADGVIQMAEFVFHRRGRQIRDFRATWRKACEKAGHPGTLFHDLRRSGVRNLVRSGVSEKVAMGISGHVTRSVFDRYDIVSEDDLRNALRKTDAYVGGKKDEVDESAEQA